jgi:hypothetical protein
MSRKNSETSGTGPTVEIYLQWLPWKDHYLVWRETLRETAMTTKIDKAQRTKICPKCGRPYLRTITKSDGMFYVHREGKGSPIYRRPTRVLGYGFKWKYINSPVPYVAPRQCFVASGASAEEPGEPLSVERSNLNQPAANDIAGKIGALILIVAAVALIVVILR